MKTQTLSPSYFEDLPAKPAARLRALPPIPNEPLTSEPILPFSDRDVFIVPEKYIETFPERILRKCSTAALPASAIDNEPLLPFSNKNIFLVPEKYFEDFYSRCCSKIQPATAENLIADQENETAIPPFLPFSARNIYQVPAHYTEELLANLRKKRAILHVPLPASAAKIRPIQLLFRYIAAVAMVVLCIGIGLIRFQQLPSPSQSFLTAVEEELLTTTTDTDDLLFSAAEAVLLQKNAPIAGTEAEIIDNLTEEELVEGI